MNIGRRNILKLSLFVPFFLSSCKTTILREYDNNSYQILKPKRLSKGSMIGIVAPGSHVPNPDDIEKAIEIINYFGFKYKLGSSFDSNSTGYKTKKPILRANEINEMFNDKNIDGIICIRGGYGTSQILEHLDYELIRRNPKFLLGYSDITALHLAIFKQCNLITFHGPVLLSKFNDFTANHLNLILNEKDITKISFRNPFDKEGIREIFPVRIINEGIAEGRLIGGNLSLITSLIGTKYLPDFKDKILYLEEVGETTYRIDRMLNQMRMAGLFDGLRGIAFASCNDCNPGSSQNTWDLSLGEVLDYYIKPLKIPALYGLLFGHTDYQLTIPNGCLAKIDAVNKTIELLEIPYIN